MDAPAVEDETRTSRAESHMSSRAKVFLVTGGAQGIGFAVASRLVRDGWRGVMSDVKEGVVDIGRRVAAAEGVSEDRVVGCIADTGDEDATTAAYDLVMRTHGRLDCVVANAGTGTPYRDVADLDPAEFDRVLRTNLRGVFLTVRAGAAIMRRSRSGSIVTISSVMWQRPVAGEAAYNASKAGIVALTHAVALEMAPYGVRVNSIAPGAVLTEMHLEDARIRADETGTSLESVLAGDAREIPLGRIGDPEDIAAVVAFLASDDAAFVTGATIDVNGGYVMRF